MHLEHIKVKNFGVHRKAEVILLDGLVVVRGGNGRGKSTLVIQSTLYALFGASTLDATLDDTVTRGEPVSSLKVEVKYGPYIVRRSKTSASVQGRGVKISGQAEVSNFFYELFGIQKGTETKVLVAEQGLSAGILAGKPGEVNSFIEDLAGFDQIDDLIERVKLKFPSGQKAVLEDRLLELEDRKAIFDKIEFPDVEKMEADIVEVVTGMVKFNLTLSRIEEDIATANTTIQKGLKHNGDIELAARKVEERKGHLRDLETRLEDLVGEQANIPLYDQTVGEAQELIDQLDEKTKEWAAFDWLSKLQEVDEWDDDLESFERELSDTAEDVANLGRDLTKFTTIIASKKASIVTDENCTLCGQDVKHLHVEINKKLGEEIIELTALVDKESLRLVGLKEYLATLNEINNEQIRRTKWANLDYLYGDTTVVPYSYALLGEEPIRPDADAVALATQLISDYKASEVLGKKNKKDIIILQGDVHSLIGAIIPKFEGELVDLGDPTNVTEHQKELVGLEAYKFDIQSTIDKTNGALTDSKLHLNTTQQAIKAHNTTLTGLKEDIGSTLTLIKEDGRNGKIVSAIRKAKPKVLELVWTKILYSVSTTFSDTVGWEAAVEKDQKGFRINGLPVTRLSGSEKTTLGIALRATLRDIFAPTCGFLLWDEPYSDMDADRTAATTAMIQSIPGQNLVITHESDSQLAADQFIEIN